MTRRKAAGKKRKKIKMVVRKKKPVDSTKPKKKYIHHCYSQKHLLREAAKTEIYNIKSLEELINLEEEKKKKMVKKKWRDFGPKIYIKDSMRTGKREVSYRFDRLQTKRRMFPSNPFLLTHTILTPL